MFPFFNIILFNFFKIPIHPPSFMHFIVYDVNRHTRVFQIKIGKKTNPAIIGPMHNCLLFSPHHPTVLFAILLSNGSQVEKEQGYSRSTPQRNSNNNNNKKGNANKIVGDVGKRFIPVFFVLFGPFAVSLLFLLLFFQLHFVNRRRFSKRDLFSVRRRHERLQHFGNFNSSLRLI